MHITHMEGIIHLADGLHRSHDTHREDGVIWRICEKQRGSLSQNSELAQGNKKIAIQLIQKSLPALCLPALPVLQPPRLCKPSFILIHYHIRSVNPLIAANAALFVRLRGIAPTLRKHKDGNLH
jgi:hypothetical protein